MEQTLLLNASYEPLKIVNWQKAITLWCQGKVGIWCTTAIRAVSFSFAASSSPFASYRIKRFDHCPSRANVCARDDRPRAITAAQVPRNQMTDHVPVAQAAGAEEVS
jgi:hypothetical protein